MSNNNARDVAIVAVFTLAIVAVFKLALDSARKRRERRIAAGLDPDVYVYHNPWTSLYLYSLFYTPRYRAAPRHDSTASLFTSAAPTLFSRVDTDAISSAVKGLGKLDGLKFDKLKF